MSTYIYVHINDIKIPNNCSKSVLVHNETQNSSDECLLLIVWIGNFIIVPAGIIIIPTFGQILHKIGNVIGDSVDWFLRPFGERKHWGKSDQQSQKVNKTVILGHSLFARRIRRIWGRRACSAATIVILLLACLLRRLLLQPQFSK